MNARDLVALIHLVGFSTGIVLYGMLAVMTWRSLRRAEPAERAGGIPVLAAVLGLVWNAGALLLFGARDFGFGEPNAWLIAASYAALGFLPAVVVDSATRTPDRPARPGAIALCAYALSAVAAVLQGLSAAEIGSISSDFLVLTAGYAGIILILAATARRREGSHRGLAAVALAAFAVSALHLSHTSHSESWVVELIGHHASLPLVLVILYQDFRFALADLFLKRALAVLSLVAIVLAAYVTLIAPLLTRNPDSLRIGIPGVLLATWIVTALAYPLLRRAVDGFVDRVILRRTDYRKLRGEIAAELSEAGSPDAVLDVVCHGFGAALSAHDVRWVEDAGASGLAGTENAVHRGVLVKSEARASATVAVPTTDAPGYSIAVSSLAEGRRLLSDDVALLESVALLAGRRIDELRVGQERYERDLREHEMQRLAAEAELRALRAQLNPHFLFNAITTIGQLIRTSPQTAMETLYQLTSLLRAVLRGSNGEFVSVAEELLIVDAYLAIERARFEERLRIERHVPPELLSLRIPPLIVQPLVENAIKHGVAPQRGGGTVRLDVRIEEPAAEGVPGSVDGGGRGRLCLTVSDTGAGVSQGDLARRRSGGVGLANIERRLRLYYGSAGCLTFVSVPGQGTVVEVRVPVMGYGMTLEPVGAGVASAGLPNRGVVAARSDVGQFDWGG